MKTQRSIATPSLRRLPLKRVCSMQSGEGITAGSIEEDGAVAVYGGNGIRGYTTRGTHTGVYPLIGRQGALCGNVHLGRGHFWASEHAVVATPRAGVDPRWLAYALQNMGLGRFSMTAAQPGLAIDFIKDLPLDVPTTTAQTKIADLLDRETAKIDLLIAKQEQLIATLLERRRADALSRTMEPAPEWARTRIGLALTKLERAPSDDAPVVTAYRDGQVTTRDSRREDGYTLSFTEKDYQGVQRGDVVVHALDGFAGAVGVAEHSGKCTPVYHVCAPRTRNSAEYPALHIRMLGESGFLTAYAWSVRQRSVDYRNWSLFASLPVMLPPSTDQSRYASEVQVANAKVNALVAKARELIEVMKERRAALISAAVTGHLVVDSYAN